MNSVEVELGADEGSKRYVALVENAPFCIHELDREGRIVSINPAGVRAMYVAAECDILGAFFPDCVIQEDRGAAADVLARSLAGEIVEATLTFLTGKGPRRFELKTLPRRGSDGRVERITCFALDVTDQQLAVEVLQSSEERFRLAQEAAGIATWDMDVSTGRGSWSDNYWGIYGLDRDACAPGYEAWIALVHPDDRERVAARIKAALEGEAPYNTEFRIVWPDGSVRWLVGKASVFRDESGAPVRMIGVDYDVTERKGAEEELRKAHEELERRVADRTRELSEANARLKQEIAERERAEAERVNLERQMVQAQKLESLGVLTGGVAHDFNNLLVTIMGNSELALNRLADGSDARRYVGKAVDAAERASELTRQLLSYSGKAQVSPETINLSELVADMAGLLEVSTGSKVALQLDFSGEVVAVRADATQIRQVVMNLITNAAEAMPEGGVVRIRTANVSTAPASLGRLYLSGPTESRAYGLLEVADAGAGLNRETCSMIFDPFFTTKFVGRGLGLAAVLGIMRSHQGVIAVDGGSECGSTFTTLLPSVPGASMASAASTADSRWRGQGKVLVVDDEQSVCETAAAMLRHLGFETVEAFSGPEAVGLFEQLQSEIRFVLLDYAMPEMNGAETLRRIRRIRPDVPVMMTSGYSEQEATMSSDEARPAGFIEKPYRLDRLSQALRAAIDAG